MSTVQKSVLLPFDKYQRLLRQSDTLEQRHTYTDSKTKAERLPASKTRVNANIDTTSRQITSRPKEEKRHPPGIPARKRRTGEKNTWIE